MSSTIPIRATTNGSTAASTSSVYGTTPGGTPRISYSRDQLLSLASSPLSRSPPAFLPAAISRSKQPLQSTQQPAQRKAEVGQPALNATATGSEAADSDTEDTATFKFEL